jgi:hypothetical protein
MVYHDQADPSHLQDPARTSDVKSEQSRLTLTSKCVSVLPGEADAARNAQKATRASDSVQPMT